MMSISPQTFEKILLEIIEKAGSVTMTELTREMRKTGIFSDGKINTSFAIKWGLEKVIKWHWKGNEEYGGCIEPIVKKSKEKDVLSSWEKDGIDSDEKWKVFDKIGWKIKKGTTFRCIDLKN